MALLAANGVAVLKAALRATHAEKEADQMSAYYMALEIKQVQEGMMIALPAEKWMIFGATSVVEFAMKLKDLAGHIDRCMYCRGKRGEKKPPEPKDQYNNGGHVSTYKVLADKKH